VGSARKGRRCVLARGGKRAGAASAERWEAS
jgi:hypothetical protein